MGLREYLAEKVALDFANAQLTRREALKRLGLLGLSVTAAGALLAPESAATAESSTPTTNSRVGWGAGTSGRHREWEGRVADDRLGWPQRSVRRP